MSKKITDNDKLTQKTKIERNLYGLPIPLGLDPNHSNLVTVTKIDGSTGTIDTQETGVRKFVLSDGSSKFITEQDLQLIATYRTLKDLSTYRDEMLEFKNIKILPTDFVPNDTNTYFNSYIDEVNGKFPVRAANGISSLFAMKEMTLKNYASNLEFNVRNSSATGATVEVFEAFVNTDPSISKGTIQGSVMGNQTLQLDISADPIYQSSNNYIVIKFTPNDPEDLFYGGNIKVELP